MTPSSYRLHALHLYNWGAFSGRHRAEFDAGNTAILGATGSGKTTLIDALMTLLCQHPRYNLASTGGHESDRDLASYVRGASGQGLASDGGAPVARPGRCVTGLAAQFVREGRAGEGDGSQRDELTLGALLWFDGSASSAAEMNKRWFFARGAGHGLDAWLEEHHGGGVRALARLEKSSDGLQMFSSKSAYLARVQRFFEVGANAFTLLNRAAGLKQLNSIDEIFRELVLDDHSAFDDALKVAASFDELAAIHAELDVANRQYLALLPLRELAASEAAQSAAVAEQQDLQALIAPWFARQGVRLWGARAAALDAALQALQAQLDSAQQQIDAARQQEQELLALYLGAGGAGIEDLRRELAAQQRLLAERQSHVQQYRQLARQLQLDWPEALSAAALAAHQAQAAPALAQLDARQQALQAAAEDAIAQEHQQRATLQALREQEQAVRQRPGSNVPPQFQQYRAQLAAELALAEDALPFVAELIEVPAAERAWRGAIERALGSQRLRILVPPQAIDRALAWVNQRHNHLHVRLLEARTPAQPPVFWDDGFAARLQLKAHALQGALRQLLAEVDRHCVDSPEALRATPHAMTAQGLMSGRALHFDKHDHKRLDQDWMTGFDNRDRLAQLHEQIQAQTQSWQALTAIKKEALQSQAEAAQQRQLWASLQALRFDALDVAGVQQQAAVTQARLAALLDPQSDTAQAQARHEQAAQVRAALEEARRQLDQRQAAQQLELRQAHLQHERCAARVPGDEPTAQQDAALRRWLRITPDCEQLQEQERQAQQRAAEQLAQQQRRLAELHKDIIRQMARAQKEDRGALADQPQEVPALAPYLQRLQSLEEEALPEKRQRFQDYLNQASDQGVSTLLGGIDAQVDVIVERLAQLNQTLARVDFHSGRYLQLHPQPIVHPSLQELERCLRKLRSDRHIDDGGQAHFRALQAMVELLREHAGASRRTKAAQALLDARYRLQFAVHVLDRASGQVLERRTGSQGGSGGEKEIIASYVLTASLSYALCPPGRSLPLMGSIVLDEAFSKSSQAVAARIIQALHEFGLHALFVTPNKELRLLRQHTRSAVLVQRRGAQALLASLSWQEIGARAQQHASTAGFMQKTLETVDQQAPEAIDFGASA